MVSRPPTLRIWLSPDASKVRSSIGTVSAQGSTVCVFDPAAGLLVQTPRLRTY